MGPGKMVMGDGERTKIYAIVSCSVAICFELLNLYFLYKYVRGRVCTKKVKYSKILPDFIINWLQGIEIISSSKTHMNSVKNLCCTHIFVYLIIVVIIVILV